MEENEKIVLPSDLSQFTPAALKAKKAEASKAYNTLVASAQAAPEDVTDEELDYIEELAQFSTKVDGELSSRSARSTRLAGLTATAGEPEGEAEAAADETAEEAPATEEAPAVTASVPSVSAVSNVGTGGTIANQRPQAAPAVLVAAADLPNTRMGSELSLNEFTEKFLETHGRFTHMAKAGHNAQVNQNIAQIRRNYPDEFTMNGDVNDQEKLMKLANEANLPGGSLRASKKIAMDAMVAEGVPEDMALTAAGGWCAPSVTDYSVCFQTVIDGIADFPEVQAPRGGVRHNTGLDWSTIYGGGNILASANGVTGFWNRTEAQIIAGSPVKDSIQVACPSFVDTRLGVTGTWITSPILTNVGYPEFVSTFMRGVGAVHAHQVNALQIQAVVAGSTGVTLAATDPWVSDGSVTSNLLGAIEMAIMDLRYRLRLARNATVEIVLPIWVRAQFRADLSRRPYASLDALAVADSQIDSWMARRGANVQYVYDWQDAFTSATAAQPGAATAVTALPVTTQFLAYPSGTWVRAVQDVITLSAIYDSTLLPTNVVTQLFMEDGWAMLQMCPVSRVYTVPTCPSGQTTLGSQVDCVTP